LFREQEDAMRRDDHILDRAFDQMRARARACKVMHRPVGMVIGGEVEQARPGMTMRGLFP
jgi:glutamate dehydrogenase (NAD(P)+)